MSHEIVAINNASGSDWLEKKTFSAEDFWEMAEDIVGIKFPWWQRQIMDVIRSKPTGIQWPALYAHNAYLPRGSEIDLVVWDDPPALWTAEDKKKLEEIMTPPKERPVEDPDRPLRCYGGQGSLGLSPGGVSTGGFR